MIDHLGKYRNVYLLAALALALFMVVFATLITQNRQSNQANTLSVLSISPDTRVSKVKITQAFEITFNKDILPQKVFYKTEPFSDLILSADKNKLIVNKKGAWKDGQPYKITILKGTEALDGSKLLEDYVFNFSAFSEGETGLNSAH